MSIVLKPAEWVNGAENLAALAEKTQDTPLSTDNSAAIKVIYAANQEFSRMADMFQTGKKALITFGSISATVLGAGALTFSMGLVGPAALAGAIALATLVGIGAYNGLSAMLYASNSTSLLKQAVESMRFKPIEAGCFNIARTQAVGLMVEDPTDAHAAPQAFGVSFKEQVSHKSYTASCNRFDAGLTDENFLVEQHSKPRILQGFDSRSQFVEARQQFTGY